MSFSKKIIRYMENNNGYITNKTTKQLGIPTIYLTRMEHNNEIVKVSRGIYILPNIIEDGLYINYLKYENMIYINEVALTLNKMNNRSVGLVEANVPQNYNTHRIKTFKTYRVNDLKYNLGKIMIKNEFGNEIPTYDKERIICDMYLNNKIDDETKTFAIKSAIEQGLNYEKLYVYSKKLGVYDKVSFLIEIR